MPRRDRFRRVVTVAAVVAVVALGALAWGSTLLGEYSVAPAGHHHGGHGGVLTSVTDLVADSARPADVRVRLVARAGTVEIPGGRPVAGYTVNGTSPGPTIHARQGDLVEVEFVNESVPHGATLHWHGVKVPNAVDGVAGITQDAVREGGSFVYRFVVEEAGTYWYHSHQVSHVQVVGGLFGALVVEPPGGISQHADAPAVLHVFAGQHTLNGAARDEHVAAAPGASVRVRVVNTDQGTAAVWVTAPFRLVAIDGQDVVEPTVVEDTSVLVPAGGRADVEVVAPPTGAVGVHVGGARLLHVGDPAASAAPVPKPAAVLDPLRYGSPNSLAFDAGRPDRTFDYVIGRRPGIIDGRPGQFWTINGRMFPDMAMFEVREGDVVRMLLRNDSAEVHPMHLHGHRLLVVARDGVRSTGSPWQVDSLDIHPGEAYEVAFLADNPGIWADHCHTLQHAVDGLLAHVMYEGVTTPFTINGPAGNQPE